MAVFGRRRGPHRITRTGTILGCLVLESSSQYHRGSPQYEQQQSNGRASLAHRLNLHPDVVGRGAAYDDEYDRYREGFPSSEDFVISLLVNPCGSNGTRGNAGGAALGYDCCTERFGFGEYGYLKDDELGGRGGAAASAEGLEVYPSHVVARSDAPLHNIILVDESGRELPYEYSRRADDHTAIDEACVGLRDPHPSCLRERLRSVRSDWIGPCTDNNQTVDSTLSCFTPHGQEQHHCMQVSYAQTSFIHQCGGEFADSDRCGTFIEIHRQNGSPYDGEGVVLAETKITTRVTNGHTTTTIPLTYRDDPSRLLCAYQERRLRVGSMVRISGEGATCCCPPTYKSATKLGSFFCPRKDGTKDGPFASRAGTLREMLEMEESHDTYPYCHATDEDADALMCSRKSEGMFNEYILQSSGGSGAMGKYYTYRCDPLRRGGTGQYGSPDLDGTYDSTCPLGDLFQACGSLPGSRRCIGNDSQFSFGGEIGKVIHIPHYPDGLYAVSFNDNRTVYNFARHQLELHVPANNYELWFIQRNRFEKIVQKKKPFRVVWPPCSFDPVSDWYFPFTKLENGEPMRVFAQYDGFIPERSYSEIGERII